MGKPGRANIHQAIKVNIFRNNIGIVFLQYDALGEEKGHYFYDVIAKIA